MYRALSGRTVWSVLDWMIRRGCRTLGRYFPSTAFSSRTSSTSAPRTLPVGLLNLMQAQQSAAQYGTMYAGLVLVMLPTLILYICVQKQLTQGMTVGGLKG